MTRQLPEEKDFMWTGFVRDPVTGQFQAKYSDGANISSTNLVWNVGEPNGGSNEACSEISGKLFSMGA